MSNNHDDFDSEHGSNQSFARPEPSLDGVRVLVIEDNALVRQAMECILAPWGFQVTLADGALMACDHVRCNPAPDIILSDYQLNDGYNGINAIRLVREIVGTQVPACLITSDADENLYLEAEAAGVHYLQKSVPAATLRGVLSRLNPSKVGDT